MRKIEMYKGEDGKLFNTSEECLSHEDMIRSVNYITQRLENIPKDDGCSFVNGGGYVQQKSNIFHNVRNELLELSRASCNNHKWIQQSIDDNSVDPSWAGRIIGECCIDQVYRAWSRISCTDNQYREWGQPYYRSNPHEAKNIKLN